jgi:hypothetical protein
MKNPLYSLKTSILIIVLLTACSPSEASIQTAIAKTQAAIALLTPTITPTPYPTDTPKPTLTFTPSLSPTITLTPTVTDTPTVTPTSSNTPTPRPTSTPVYGSLYMPAPMGVTIIRRKDLTGEEMAATVLEVRRGDNANNLAKTELYFCFDTPIQGQEYIAIKVKLDVLKADPNEVFTIYTTFSLTLRYSDGGNDIWGNDCFEKLAEGYPPFSGTGWVFFKIKKDSKPLLYFQPQLMSLEQFGYRTSGAYFSLEQP